MRFLRGKCFRNVGIYPIDYTATESNIWGKTYKFRGYPCGNFSTCGLLASDAKLTVSEKIVVFIFKVEECKIRNFIFFLRNFCFSLQGYTVSQLRRLNSKETNISFEVFAAVNISNWSCEHATFRRNILPLYSGLNYVEWEKSFCLRYVPSKHRRLPEREFDATILETTTWRRRHI